MTGGIYLGDMFKTLDTLKFSATMETFTRSRGEEKLGVNSGSSEY